MSYRDELRASQQRAEALEDQLDDVRGRCTEATRRVADLEAALSEKGSPRKARSRAGRDDPEVSSAKQKEARAYVDRIFLWGVLVGFLIGVQVVCAASP